MLTKEMIRAYHSLGDIGPATHRIGIELELFCLDNSTLRPLPYQAAHGGLSVQTLFDYLKNYEGYKEVGTSKTFELQKGASKISLEPGAQIEFSSPPYDDISTLLKVLWLHLNILQKLSRKFHVSWLDVSYFPIGSPDDVSLLPSTRCEIIDRYWQHTGTLGRDLMRYTTSVHVSFDYATLSDLTQKVERVMFLKPIFLFITAHSRIRHGADTGLRSFRNIIYKHTDSMRTGTPGPESFWQSGHWTLDGYIDKVLQAPALFDVGTSPYQESFHQPFETYLDHATFKDYLSHLATIYTDVRVRNYLEVRYLDNPGIRLLPGVLILLYTLLYNDDAWYTFKNRIPYSFHEVPDVVDLLNTVSPQSDRYWEYQLLKPMKELLVDIGSSIESGLAVYLEDVLERVVNYKRVDVLPDMKSDESIIAHFKNSFPFQSG